MSRDNHRLAKEKKERDRAAKAARKRARKRVRPSFGPDSGPGDDPDLAGIVVGPQPKDELSEEEVARAVELAMNPQARRARSGEGRRGGSSKLFVGNLDFRTSESELEQLFTEAGFEVQSASIPLDRESGRSRGFAFVELADGEQADRANEHFDGFEFHGRTLRVNAADDR